MNQSLNQKARPRRTGVPTATRRSPVSRCSRATSTPTPSSRRRPPTWRRSARTARGSSAAGRRPSGTWRPRTTGAGTPPKRSTRAPSAGAGRRRRRKKQFISMLRDTSTPKGVTKNIVSKAYHDYMNYAL